MKPIRFVRCEMRTPRFDPHPEKSKTNNHEWRQGLFIVFEDYDGNIYDYMPRWQELDIVMKMKMDIEVLNRKLLKEIKDRENKNKATQTMCGQERN